MGLGRTDPDRGLADLPLPVVLSVGFGGYIAGLLVLKTRSLMMPIAVHTAIDLPVYGFFACRNPLPV